MDTFSLATTMITTRHLNACRTITLPIRFQCPLCFDVLRYPMQLPCCQRHLCTECFERALELTSVNCGFCRKRIVGFARKKQYAVDTSLWQEIQLACPSVLNGTIDVDFIDITSHRSDPILEEETHPTGELKQYYERQLKEYQAARQLVEETSCTPDLKETKKSKPSRQKRLETFFEAKTSTSTSNITSKCGHDLRVRRRPATVGKKQVVSKPLLRSASHSPKRRKQSQVQKKLLQLTLTSPPVVRPISQPSEKQRAWRCLHCTYENTCFDQTCSMCHQSKRKS